MRALERRSAWNARCDAHLRPTPGGLVSALLAIAGLFAQREFLTRPARLATERLAWASKRIGVLVVIAALCLAACAPSYVLVAPPAFKRFEEVRGLEMITADGVILKVREEDNYPRAELPFWKDALRGHLDARGYAFKSERCFKTARGLDGCTLDFVVPRGAEDWVMSETLFVDGDTIYLVEVAGPYTRYTKVEPALAESMSTFAPRP